MLNLITILLSWSFFLVFPVLAQECDFEWEHLADTGSCYLFVTVATTISEANRICQEEYNSTLVSVQSSKENGFLRGYMELDPRLQAKPIHGFWLGLQYDQKKDWFWLDGTPFTYSDFVGSNPGDCAVFFKHFNHHWIENLCSSDGFGFICKKADYSGGYSETQALRGVPWWCGIIWGTVCGPNCCANGECCAGPNVCATGNHCANLQCRHRGGEVCGNNCCEKDSNKPICCYTGENNVCVSSLDECNLQKCVSSGGQDCGNQCCRDPNVCCGGVEPDTCATLSDCNSLACLQAGDEICGENCCRNGTICCKGQCVQTVEECLTLQCQDEKGQVCDQSCCLPDSLFPYCCITVGSCTKDAEECKKAECPQWCHSMNDCCNQPSYVCCPAGSRAICSPNPLLCRPKYAEILAYINGDENKSPIQTTPRIPGDVQLSNSKIGSS